MHHNEAEKNPKICIVPEAPAEVSFCVVGSWTPCLSLAEQVMPSGDHAHNLSLVHTVMSIVLSQDRPTSLTPSADSTDWMEVPAGHWMQKVSQKVNLAGNCLKYK